MHGGMVLNVGSVKVPAAETQNKHLPAERGGDWKKCNEWKKWVEETGSRAEKPQRRSRGWRGYRYTVFLGETIITMSNGSSHRSLPQPSTVISRTFFFQPGPHVRGSGKPHSACWTCPLAPPPTLPNPSCWRAGRHYLGGHFIFRSREPSMASSAWSITSLTALLPSITSVIFHPEKKKKKKKWKRSLKREGKTGQVCPHQSV